MKWTLLPARHRDCSKQHSQVRHAYRAQGRAANSPSRGHLYGQAAGGTYVAICRILHIVAGSEPPPPPFLGVNFPLGRVNSRGFHLPPFIWPTSHLVPNIPSCFGIKCAYYANFFIQRSNINVRKIVFPLTVTEPWNNLPESVNQVKSINSCKNCFDKFWPN